MNDDVRRRIEAVVKIRTAFQNVVSVADKLGVTLPESLNEALARLENEFKSLSEYSERQLRIAVAGKFSCGKSQFINSLIGKEIASVDSARTTCCKTIFTGDTSVDGVIITDSTGKTYSRDEYVLRSAKVSASREVFTVKLPDADWSDFEVIDTPGYDSLDEEDRQISEEAVADADVVFFRFDIGNGTIPKDSMVYLKNTVDTKQLFITGYILN
ncbi:MAG: dynamin family protein [Kiritimatiellia bacterium]